MTWLQGLAWLPAGVWVCLLLFRGWFWLPTLRLSPDPAGVAEWRAVAVVVPARNEAEMISESLPSLMASTYPGPVTVYLVDDCSEDGTARTAEEAAARSRRPGGPSLRLVEGAERPPGWVGKTWALQQGWAAAAEADPGFVLFTDADIHHPPDSLTALVSHAEAGPWDLVSLMARLRTVTGWEKLIVPAFVYFFSQLYPFRSIARPRSRTAGAAGGCVLVRPEALRRAGGIEAIAAEVIDDVALGRAVKRAGGSTWLGYGDEVRSLRPYPELADLWAMVARSAYTQLRYSPAALVGTVAGLAVIYFGPLAVLVSGLAAMDPTVVAAGAVAEFLLTSSYLPMILYYRTGLAWVLTLPAAAALYGVMTVDSARLHYRGRGAAWKGRTYSSSVPNPPA